MPYRPVVVPLLLLAVIAFGVVACRGPGTRARQEASDVYRNARFGFVIRYPSDLRPEPSIPRMMTVSSCRTATGRSHSMHMPPMTCSIAI